MISKSATIVHWTKNGKDGIKMKKIIGFLCLATAVLSLAACGNDAKKESAENTGTDKYEEIKKAGTLKVGTEGTYAPFSYHDEAGDLVGYDVEIAEAVGEELGLKIEFVEAPWDSLIAAFDANKCDIVFNQVGITDERKEKYAFSVPYTFSHTALVTKKGNTEIKSFADLEGKKSAQTITSNYAKVAESYGASIESTDGFSKAVELLIAGRADATLNDDVAYYDFLKQKPDAEIQIAATDDEVIEMAALVKKDQKELLAAVDEALEKLKAAGTLTEISNKYFDKDISQESK